MSDTPQAEFRIVKHKGRWQWELDDGGDMIAVSSRGWRTRVGAYLGVRRFRREVARIKVDVERVSGIA